MRNKKSYAVFGLGRYGLAVAKELIENGMEVIAVDNRQDVVNEASAYIPVCKCADITDSEVIEQLGISEIDVVIICMASNLEGSVMAITLCKEVGVKYVIAKDNHNIDANYCYDIVKCCNERYDGHGFPQGLSGNSIPIVTQIVSLAIEYNNLINSIMPVDYDKVASLIIIESGRKFNPKIVDCFKKVRSEFEAITKVGG